MNRFTPTHVIINSGVALLVSIDRDYLYTKKEWSEHTMTPEWFVIRRGLAEHSSTKIQSPFYKIVIEK